MNSRIDELIALAALGELSEQESAELDAATAADSSVAAELDEALATAAALQSSPVEPPPPHLKRSVMDAVAGLSQLPDVEPTTALAGIVGAGETPAVAGRLDPARRRRRFAPLLAAAAVLVLVAGGVIIGTNEDTEDDPIAAVVQADDAVSHSVSGEIGDLEFWYSPEEEAVVLVGDSLEPAPADATYQVWLVNDGGFTSLGTFEPEPDGSMEMRGDGIDPTGSTIGITVEPVGGSDQPTSPPVAESIV